MKRRTDMSAAAAWLVARPLQAAPSREEQRQQNRIELWHNYAAKTENLVARLTTTRETSLLDEPLTVTGSLLFVGPGTLVLRDDGLSGSTTVRTVVIVNDGCFGAARREPGRRTCEIRRHPA